MSIVAVTAVAAALLLLGCVFGLAAILMGVDR